MLSKLKGIDIAFYIFLLTAFGYVITYLYQWGYYNYFSIPVSFIELSVSSITKSFTLLGVFFSFIFLNVVFFEDKTDLKTLFNKFISIKILTNNIIKNILQILCTLGVFYLVYTWRVSGQSEGINYLATALVFFSGYCYLKKYLKLVLVSWVILMFMLPYMVGWSNAKTQEHFYIIDNKEDYLIIDFYNDKAIAAKFDSKQKIIYPNFKFISVDSLERDKKELKIVNVNKISTAPATKIK